MLFVYINNFLICFIIRILINFNWDVYIKRGFDLFLDENIYLGFINGICISIMK